MEYFLLYQVNKGCHSHQPLQPSNLSRWALRKLRKEKNTCYPAAITLHPSLRWAPRTRGMWTQGNLAPESWSAHQRDGFSGPRLLQLPIHRKALHSLIGQIWFLWLTVIFSCPDYLPFFANPPHVLACPVTSSEKLLRNTVSLAAVLILPHVKLSSQFNVLQFFPTLYILKTITKPVFKNGSIPK